jgi:hypothetical protein
VVSNAKIDCTTPYTNNPQNFDLMKLTIFFTWKQSLLLAACGLILPSCSGLSPTPTLTPSPVLSTDTPTTTIVWFPPTNTPLEFPTQPVASTLEYHPGVGDLLFSDSFDQPELWNTSTSSLASAIVTRNRLVLSITGTGPVSINSLRSQPTVGDFYAEAMADVSLCSGKDQYGMAFRAAPGGNYYRYVINCNGQVRLERGNSGVTYPIQDWQPSGDATIGAPAQVRIGVWAAGSELRVFLNDHYQFTIRDPLFHTGTIGFFIYANGKTPITVSFSDLSVYSVFYLSPTPSLTSSRTPTPSRTPKP